MALWQNVLQLTQNVMLLDQYVTLIWEWREVIPVLEQLEYVSLISVVTNQPCLFPPRSDHTCLQYATENASLKSRMRQIAFF